MAEGIHQYNESLYHTMNDFRLKINAWNKFWILVGELAEMEAELEADLVAEDIMVQEQMQQQATT